MQSEIKEQLAKCCGFGEVNAAIPEAAEGDIFQFAGCLPLVSHLLNLFARRDWCQAANSPYLASTFATVNDSQVL